MTHILSREPAGVPTGGRFAATHHSEAGLTLTAPGSTMETMDEDYRVSHRAPTNDGYSSPITRLGDAFGDDVFDHPDYYGDVDKETMEQLRAVRDDPNASVRIYRAVPPGVEQINQADWVSLSLHYAQQHAIQDGDTANDWPIISSEVPCSNVFSDGSDLSEYGYDGPTLSQQAEPGPWDYRDVHFHAAHRAVVEGTARNQLHDDFQRSDMDFDQLAGAVGHTPRVARRVIEGKEFLTETTVGAYFRALGHQATDQDRQDHSAEQETLTSLP